MELVIGGHYLSAFTSWGDLDWGLCWPGYTDELTFDVASHPSILKTGAPVSLVWGGEALASGTLEEPVRGQQLRVAGLHKLCDNYAALDGSNNLSIDPDVAVPAAIARGLPVTFDLGFGPVGPLGTNEPTTISALLDAQVSLVPGYGWGIDPKGKVLRMPHTTPRLHVRPGGDDLGIAWDNYASKLIARYFDSTSNTYVTGITTDTAAAARWGYREVTVPEALNDGAAMTLTQAATVLESMMANGRARPGWTTPIEVEYGAVLNDRQQPVDLASIKPYEKIRIHGLTEDVADLAGQSYVDMPIARIRHNKPDRSAVITPVGLVSPMTDILSGKSAA